MNRKLLFTSLTVALGGFLFGFDTAVISGAEQAIQRLWRLSDAMHGFAVAMALYGTVIGALFGGIPADRLGRKQTLVWIGLLYLVSALGSALAPEVYSFMFFRFIGGVGVGASSVAAPLYISEIAPPNARGRLVALFQFNIVLGILIAYTSNYLLQGIGGAEAWRWMLGVEVIPAALFSILVLGVPQSPRWLLVMRNDEIAARASFQTLHFPNETIDHALSEIKKSILVQKSGQQEPLFSPRFRMLVVLAFLFAFFNQVSGINAVIYYAPRIFELAGLDAGSALFSSVGIGLVNLFATLVAMTLIDKLGRKTLMYIGSVGYLLSLGLIARAFFTSSFEGITTWIFIFIGAHAVSQGAVIWVFISEIFPNQVRAGGQALGSFTHWIMAALIANSFPFFAAQFGGGIIFSFFFVMMVLQLLFVGFLMPETKNLSLEEIEKHLLKN